MNEVAVVVPTVLVVWKIHCGLCRLRPFRVSVDAENEKNPSAEQYTPGRSVIPAKLELCKTLYGGQVAPATIP